MASEITADDAFGYEGIAAAKQLIDEIDQNLNRVNGTTGIIVTDKQDERIIRVLRILVGEVERLRGAD